MQAEENKNKYDFLAASHVFVPVAVEITGVWSEDALRFIQQVGQKITDASGEIRATAFLFQRLSVTLQRGNAASILGTLPSGRGLEKIYKL